MKSHTVPQRVQLLSRLVSLASKKDLPRLPADRAHRNGASCKCSMHLGARRKYGNSLGMSQDTKGHAVGDLNRIPQNLEARNQQLQVLSRARVRQLTKGRIDLRDIPQSSSLSVLSGIRAAFRWNPNGDGQSDEGTNGLNPSSPISRLEIETCPSVDEENCNGDSSRTHGQFRSCLHSCLQPSEAEV